MAIPAAWHGLTLIFGATNVVAIVRYFQGAYDGSRTRTTMYEGSKQPETAHAQYSTTIETQSLGRRVVLDVFRDYRAIYINHVPKNPQAHSMAVVEFFDLPNRFA